MLSWAVFACYNEGMPRQRKSGESTEDQLTRVQASYNQVLEANERRDELLRNVARTTFSSLRALITEALPETDGLVNEYDFRQVYPAAHMRGVLRAARFENGSAIQLTTSLGFEDRVHTFLLENTFRDPFYRYVRDPINVSRRSTPSKPFETYGLDGYIEDPNNIILIGDVRSLADIQARDHWPDAFTPEELEAIRGVEE